MGFYYFGGKFKETFIQYSLQMSQFQESYIFLCLCNKTRNSYCKQMTGINCFKNENVFENIFSLMRFIYLEFISSETRLKLLKHRTKVGLQHQVKKKNPSAVRGHRILTDQIAQLSLHERVYLRYVFQCLFPVSMTFISQSLYFTLN